MSGWFRLRAPFDRILAVALLVVTAPVVLVTAFCILLDDGGPAFVRVPRIGRGGRHFSMLKLRTMRTQSGGAPITSGDDPRITAVGRVLRRLHLDELPQLVHVLRGEMSLLGPRPETPALVDADDPGWVSVLRARPGIAGATQIVVGDWEASCLLGPDDAVARYRDAVLPVKLAIDSWYVEHATPWIDVLTLVSLVQGIFGVERTLIDRRVRREVAATVVIGVGRQPELART